MRSRTERTENVSHTKPVKTCVQNDRCRRPDPPSVPAIRKLLEQLRGSASDNLRPDRAMQILRLDPPALLRAVGYLSAPIAAEHPTRWTVETIAKALGPTRTAQTLAVATNQTSDHARQHELWLHAIATAHGARSLAAATGLMDPDEAYLAGLLHDLPRWLSSDTQRSGDASAAPATYLSCLPECLASVVEACQNLTGSSSSADVPDHATVVIAAELLAELAGFAHPDPSAHQANLEDNAFALLGPSQLAAADTLREQVQQSLAAAGLSFSASAALKPDWGNPESDDSASANDAPTEQVVSSLTSQRFDSYRKVINASAKVARECLGYDRVVAARWIAETGQLVVHNLAADDRRRTFVVQTTEHERDILAQTVAAGKSAHLTTTPACTSSLLDLMRTEEVLAVPINPGFQIPTVLLLDRGLSGRPIQMQCDAERANALGSITTLLSENLLLARQGQRAQRFALTDALTRLYNRRVGVANLDQEIARCQRTQSPLTILMIDLDDFKGLNDTYGHLQGDHALRDTAEVLRKTMRRGDTVCRYGGEEFLVVLPSTKADEAAILAARLFTAIEDRGQQIGLPLTVSIGQSSLRSGDTIESCLQRADQALYASKSLGRNRFSVDAEPD